MALFLAPTHSTIVADVHTVSLCPALSSHVLDVFPVHPLVIWLALPIHRQPRHLLYPVVVCWICWVKVATVLVRLEMALYCDITVSLSAAAAVARLMRTSCIPSISFMLFALWYPPRESTIFAFYCTPAALPGRAPASSPNSSRPRIGEIGLLL